MQNIFHLGNSLCSKRNLCEFCEFLREILRFFAPTLWQHCWKAKPSQEDEDDHAMSSGDYFRSYDELSVLGAGSFGRAIKCRARTGGGGGWVPKGHETFVVKEVRGRHSTKIRRDKKRSFIRRFFCGLFCALQIAILPVPAQSIFKGYSFFLLRSKAPTEATKRKPSCLGDATTASSCSTLPPSGRAGRSASPWSIATKAP